MDQRSRCKAVHYKTLTGKHSRTLFDVDCSNMFLFPPPRVMKIKTKTKGSY